MERIWTVSVTVSDPHEPAEGPRTEVLKAFRTEESATAYALFSAEQIGGGVLVHVTSCELEDA